MKRAGLDLDGVVYQWSPTARRMIREEFGLDVGDSLTWGHIRENVTPAMWKWLWSEGVARGLFSRGPAYDGALHGIRKLRETHDLIVITARPEDARTSTLFWLALNDVRPREVHIVPQGFKKSSITADWYVDDNLDNVRDLATTGRPVFLFDQAWNAPHLIDAPLPGNVVRVHDWPDLLDEVSLLA